LVHAGDFGFRAGVDAKAFFARRPGFFAIAFRNVSHDIKAVLEDLISWLAM